VSSNGRISVTDRHAPGDLSVIKVDRNELRVWRLGNWNCTQRACGSLDYPGAVVMVFRIDARITPVVLADLIDVDIIGALHVQQTRFRIEGGSAPVRASSVGGPHERTP